MAFCLFVVLSMSFISLADGGYQTGLTEEADQQITLEQLITAAGEANPAIKSADYAALQRPDI